MSTGMSGKFHRLWLDMKATLTHHNRKPILQECERGEDDSMKAYEKALEAPDLPTPLVSVLRKRAELHKAAHDHILILWDNID